MSELPSLMTGREIDAFRERRDSLVSSGVPEELAVRVAVLPPAYGLLGVIETADRLDLDPFEVTRLHFAVGESHGLPLLVARTVALPRQARWPTVARAERRAARHRGPPQLPAPGPPTTG